MSIFIFYLSNYLCNEKNKKRAVVVTVRTVCDAKYKRLHPKDWNIRAKKITQEATKALSSKFNIKFSVRKAVYSPMLNSKDAYKIFSKFAKNNRVKGKYDMVICFSGNKSRNDILGLTYMGKTYDNTQKEHYTEGCLCCFGDEPIAADNNIFIFIDSEGNLSIFMKDEEEPIINIKVNRCPNCGIRFL